MRREFQRVGVAAAAVVLIAAVLAVAGTSYARESDDRGPATATPIKHLVEIFQENVSFDHYFGTYPVAANTDGQPFFPEPGTPSVNNLGNPHDPNAPLLYHNQNSANPFRLSSSQALTCDQNHNYLNEQRAFDHGLMDKFVQNTTTDSCNPPDVPLANTVMGYYDGNTVTAMWQYAQHFAMSDNSYNTVFGPSTPGALNLISGQTGGATPPEVAGNTTQGTDIGDLDPSYDDCSAGTRLSMSGRNIGNLLNDAGVSWGFFQGGFRPTSSPNGVATCGAAHTNVGGATVTDYSAHHEPFQYYASTANPHHLPPASTAEIGHAGPANHQYDMTDFYTALNAGNLPAVSYLKAPRYQDGHPGYSDPLDEQHFVVNVINQLQKSRDWASTAVVINYDDSDGWYDHQMSTIVNHSQTAYDGLSAPGQCGTNPPAGGLQGRCAYGPRLPLLVISPFARVNHVDSTLTDQTSTLRFIEDNWLGGKRVEPMSGTSPDGLTASFDNYAGRLDGLFDFQHPQAGRLFLNPVTGQPTQGGEAH
ncbi:MAG TPA: alkaline phosphatase family protein [Acidimicrobiales bacterium]|jgi:phospholipase C|nr:alkaline phosphatase family protein [Acidimicrobiales bacterium]